MQQEPNTLGSYSLAIGVVSATAIVGTILCAAAGARQGWLRLAGTPLFVCAATIGFLGLVGVFLGIVGLFGRNQRRGVAVAGLLLSALTICLLLAAVSRLGR